MPALKLFLNISRSKRHNTPFPEIPGLFSLNANECFSWNHGNYKKLLGTKFPRNFSLSVPTLSSLSIKGNFPVPKDIEFPNLERLECDSFESTTTTKEFPKLRYLACRNLYFNNNVPNFPTLEFLIAYEENDQIPGNYPNLRYIQSSQYQPLSNFPNLEMARYNFTQYP